MDNTHMNENQDGNVRRISADVFDFNDHICENIHIAFAFPPCTHLASSGSGWWKTKGDDALTEALQLVYRCWDIISCAKSYMLENPVGRLSTIWRKPNYTFNPYEYGGYLGDCVDNYTKKTCLWVGGDFYMPPKKNLLKTYWDQ